MTGLIRQVVERVNPPICHFNYMFSRASTTLRPLGVSVLNAKQAHTNRTKGKPSVLTVTWELTTVKQDKLPAYLLALESKLYNL